MSFCMTFGCSVLHVIRDALVVMLSEAKHLSHPFAYYHPFFLSHSHFARAVYLCASLSFRPSLPLSFRPSAPHCHVERSETSFTLFLSLSFRPSGASGEICIVVRGTVVGIYGLRRLQSGAAGSSTLKGSPRAWLLLEYHPPQCLG